MQPVQIMANAIDCNPKKKLPDWQLYIPHPMPALPHPSQPGPGSLGLMGEEALLPGEKKGDSS